MSGVRNPDVEAERYAQTDAERGREADHAGFYNKHRGLWHGPWCHLRDDLVELDAVGLHTDCYECPCQHTCGGPRPEIHLPWRKP